MYVYSITYGPVLNLHSDVAVVEFERTYYEFQKSEGAVEVCATVSSPEDVSCPIEFDFFLSINIDGGGNYGPLTLYIIIYFPVSVKGSDSLDFPQNVTRVCKGFTNLSVGVHTVTLAKDEDTHGGITIGFDTASINIIGEGFKNCY